MPKINLERKLQLLRVVSIPIILGLWSFITLSGIVKPLYLPSPLGVFSSLGDIGVSTFLLHSLATTLRILIGFLLGAFFGILLGLLMGYSKYVDAVLYNIIESWRPVPPVALIPFFILWFGFSEYGKLLLVFLGCSLIMVVNTYEAVRNVPTIYKRAAYCLGAKKRHVFSKVIIYAILPELASGLRIALALSISLVIVSEFMGADYGLGYLINISKVTFSMSTIFLGILVIGLIAWILDFFLQKIINHFTRWTARSTEATNK